VIADGDLWRSMQGFFFQHWILTATFCNPMVLKNFLRGAFNGTLAFYLV